MKGATFRRVAPPLVPRAEAVANVTGAQGFTIYVACEGRSYERRGFASLALAVDAAPKLARTFRLNEEANAYWDVKDGCGTVVECGALEPPRARAKK